MPHPGWIKRCWIMLLLAQGVAWGAWAQPKAGEAKAWDKLRQETPAWFQDAKFGIYFHWGVYAVPAFNSEWYSRGMYLPDSKSQKYHLATYGPVERFGYKEFIPQFTAEQFDADAWVDLFVKAGARFAGPVAEHADGFSMWASKVNPWNAQAMGPKRDIVGEMEKAVRKRGLKFIATFHHQWRWGWYPTFDKQLDVGNPQFASLYGPVVSEAAWNHKDEAEKPDAAFNRNWLAKVQEVTKQYRPDLLYFDSRLGHIGEPYRQEVVKTFARKTKGKDKKGVILYKHTDLPEGVGVRTHEKSRVNQLSDKPWLTEETISTYSWCYTQDMQLRPVQDMLHGLIDVVSKNGVYLLNISPMADGTIPQDQREILLGIGQWLGTHGEAIYGTRPWYTYGEGPRKEAAEKETEGDRKKFFELKYTAEDVRYTTAGNTVYALVLGQPSAGQELVLQAFATDKMPNRQRVTKVSIIGSSEKVVSEEGANGLTIRIPAGLTPQMATVFKIELVGKGS